MSRSARIAWAASLLGHAFLITGILASFRSLRGTGTDPSFTDTRVSGAEDYTPVRLMLINDAPSVQNPESPPPRPLPAAMQQPLEPKKDITPTHGSQTAPNSPTTDEAKPAAHTAHSIQPAQQQTSSVPRLHGTIRKAGFRVVYVIDRSSSMGREAKLKRAKEIVAASLQELNADVLFQVVVYDSTASILPIEAGDALAKATPENIARAEALLTEIEAEGSSLHRAGLQRAMQLQPDLLILLTDGDDLSVSDLRDVKEWNRAGKTRIYGIIFPCKQGEPSTGRLAEICEGGKVLTLPSP